MDKNKINTYAFIDGQNMNMGVSTDIIDKMTGKKSYVGWKLDFKKFRIYLRDKYKVTKAYYFIGNKPGNESLYSFLQDVGYQVVLKPTLPYMKDGVNNTKGNVDAELVLYASALVYDKYDQAVLVSGDGDFLCLAEYLEAEGKLSKIITPNSKYSSLLNKFASRILIVGTNNDLKKKLEYTPNKKAGLSGRSKP